MWLAVNLLRSGSLDVLLRAVFVTLGWALFAFLVTRTSSTALDSKIYDPYEILGIAKVCSTFAKTPKSNELLFLYPTRVFLRRRSSHGSRNSP